MMSGEGVDKLDFDPYELLEVTEESTEKELVKGFRKMALKWHPDKNPDRKEYAQEMFLKVSKAFEILSDAAVKAAYDKLRKARRAAKERTKHLDAKRRKLREELESRESGLQRERDDEALAARKLQREIERLRKQGSTLLETEKERIEKEIQTEKGRAKDVKSRLQPETDGKSDSTPKVKISWKTPSDSETPAHTEEALKDLFSKYGEIGAIVVREKKSKGTAIIEFQSVESANLAVELEKGSKGCPLSVSWLDGKPPTQHTSQPRGSTGEKTQGDEEGKEMKGPGTSDSGNPAMADPGLSSGKDFESVVLMKLRQAEERKRLIQEMKDQDVSLQPHTDDTTLVLD